VATSEPIRREYPDQPIASAHAIVIRGDRVLLVQRAAEPSKGQWSVPGGVIELGETIAAAVRREVREECGIEIEPGQVVNVADRVSPDEAGRIRHHYVVIYLLARYVGGEARASSDAAAVRWVTHEELDGLDMVPVARQALQRAFELDGVGAIIRSI
jgi:ADP-ribose pyrophosphatase YjhB (NUDIX family)